MSAPPRLILASTSLYRRELLTRLSLPFETRAPDCDEDSFKALAMTPRALAERLALEKAQGVARREPGAVVIGSDQVVDLDGEILGKPGSVEAAEAQLRRMRGKTHQLITALSVVDHHGRAQSHTDMTQLTMRSLSAEAIHRYVAHDRPLDCAGSYKIECLGVALFEHIECADYNAIAGLPLIALVGLLTNLGFSVP